MTAPLYVSRCTMDKLGSLHRRAHLVHGATADMGVHGPIRELFQLAPERELPLPVDYVVAAVAGCMFGTLNGALEVRQIKLSGGDRTCAAEGDNEVRDGIPVLTAVRLRYRLRIPAGTREAVDRALARHQDKCPTAVTLKSAVKITWEADIQEV